jgi:hypothetical protein
MASRMRASSLSHLRVGFASAITRGQSGESLGEEALLPGVNGALGARELAPDRAKRVALGEQKNDLGAARFCDRNGPAAETAPEFFVLLGSQSDLSIRHAACGTDYTILVNDTLQ